MKSSRERRRQGLLTFLAAAALMITAVVLGAPTAQAQAPTEDRALAVATVEKVPAAEFGTSSYTYTCFGNKGTFADSSRILYIDWSYDVPECYGVAPSGTIWHTWQGAAKWYEMPGNGLATDMEQLYDWGNGDRTVQVYVNWASWKYYCQDYNYGQGWARSWYRC